MFLIDTHTHVYGPEFDLDTWAKGIYLREIWDG